MKALATKTEGERSAPGGATAAANRQRDQDGFTGPSLLEPALEPEIGPESESSSAIGEKVPEAAASESNLGPGQRAMGSLSRLNAIVNRSAKVAALSKLDVALNARPGSGAVARVATPRRNPLAEEGLSTIASAPMGAGRGAEGTTVEQRFPVIAASAPAEQAGREQEASGAAPERSSASLIAFMRQPASEIAGGFDGIGPALAGQMGTERTEHNARPPEIQAFLPGAEAGASDQVPRLGQNPLPNAAKNLLAPADPAKPELGALEAQVPGQPGGHNLSTDAGPAPTYRVDGETSPARTDATRANASSQAAGARDALAGDIAADRSGERIQPIGVDRADALKLEEKDRSIRTESSLEMLEYAGAPVPGSVFQIADGDLAPLLDASLEGPRHQVADAAAKRDQSRAEAVQQGQQEADQARDQAHAEQQAAIADGRRQVEATKQQGLTESQAELRRFETQADAEHERTRGDIESRIATDQAAADKAIADGEQQARAEQAEAERQAAEAEAEKQRRKTRRKKKGLWGKIVGWVVEISQAVLDWFKARLNDIFDLAKRAIKGILEGAKKLAVGIVRSLRTAVIGMIKGLATVLTTLVSTFLFFLPSLRDRINGAIDNVVSNTVAVVDRIAQTLEDKVSALVDKVGGLLNRVVEVFEIAVMTTLTVTAALLRGDFKGAARALFIAACKTLGIDGEMLLSILADAASALIHIIKKPASFLGNLLKSVKQGFGSFVANFKDRFSQGMGGWLFGNLAQGGAQLPSKLDLKSIFTMITQVLGFTFEFVRGRAVRKVGERKVGILEQVLTQVKTLVTEGPAAVWNWVKDQASKLKTLVVETVSDWMVTQLVAKAAMKLATMFTPVGAFIQAIKMVYDTLMFFIEKAKDIMALVKSITASFKQMAQGAVAAAANYIDQSMAKAIPLIIAFLANLVGLGGLGAKVREIVNKLREPVTRAIDFVLDKIIGAAKATWKGIKTGPRRLADWWKARETFRDQEGGQHQLYFQRAADGRRYILMVASEPLNFEAHLQQIRKNESAESYLRIQASYAPIRREFDAENSSEVEGGSVRREIIKENLRRLSESLENSSGADRQVGHVGSQFELDKALARVSRAIGSSVGELKEFMREEGITEAHVISLAADMTPGVSAAKGVSELFTGVDPITGEEASRWFALAGLIPFGAIFKKFPRLTKLFEQFKKFIENRKLARATKESTASASRGLIKKWSKSHRSWLRRNSPSKEVRERFRRGRFDPLYKGVIAGGLEADHIVPFEKIVNMEGFTALTVENQLKVLNDERNFVGLVGSINASRRSQSFKRWDASGGHFLHGRPENRKKLAELIHAEETLPTLLKSRIEELLTSQRVGQ